jgi:hypothetical protein
MVNVILGITAFVGVVYLCWYTRPPKITPMSEDYLRVLSYTQGQGGDPL